MITFFFFFFYRAERSEVLSEDLLSVEKRVEQVRSACMNTAKKLDLSMQGSGTDFEKRLVSISASSSSYFFFCIAHQGKMLFLVVFHQSLHSEFKLC